MSKVIVKQFSVSCILLALFVIPLSAGAQVSFSQPPVYSGGGSPQFIADFNGDGKPDILTSDGTLNLGNGDGTFTLGTSLSNTSVPILAVADFNGDGRPDALEYNTSTSMLQVLLGNGDGTFQAPISTFSNASLTVFAAKDLNGDGKADVVAVWNASLYAYISNGDGTFKPGVPYNLGALGSNFSPFFGDFNSDGKTDVAVSVIANNSFFLVVFLGNGDGTFQTTPKTSASVNFGEYFAVGDFNSDGKLDLVISQPPCVISESCEVYVQLGNGDGSFQAPVVVFPGTGALAAADLNGDGKLDLSLVSSMDPFNVQIYLGNGDATFSSPISYGVSLGGGGGAGGNAITIADVNGDGRLDISAGGILLGNGDGTFKGIPLAVLPNLPTATAVGDFEKKGAPDVAALFHTNLYVLSNNGSGALSLIHTYALQQDDAAIVTADFNGDGKLDLALLGTDPTTQNWSYSVMLGNGDGSFQSPVTYIESGPPPYTFLVADFNGDQKPDLAFGFGSNNSASSDAVAILLGNGDGTFASPVYYYDAGGQPVVADFNSDGKLDIAFGNNAGTGIWYGYGDGTFQAPVFPSSLTSYYPRFTADFNNDGNPDLCCPVALGNGDGTFALEPPFTLPSNVGSFEITLIADLNGDGNLDLLGTTFGTQTAHPADTAIFLGNGDGTFGSLTNLTNGVMALGLGAFSSVSAVDMNGDGLTDIVFPWANYQGICTPCVGTPTGVAVLFNTTKAGPPQPDFQIFHSGLSPTPVTAGSSATATITVAGLNGFTGNVALSCTGLPAGITCSFNPASITGASGTGMLTVPTTSAVQPGSYTVIVSGVSGSVSHIVPLTLTVVSGSTRDFQISATATSPATVAPGNSATSTVTIAALNGFSSAVALTCVSGASGVTCGLNPASVTPSGGTSLTSTLTINTTSGTVLGTHSVTIFATSGSTIHSVGVTVTVQPSPPDFTIGPASGSKTSQTISAGQTASFQLVFGAIESFSGTVNLSCAITPAVTPAPTCNLSGSSVQISTSTSQTVTVTVGTTASTTTSVGPGMVIPPGAMLPAFMLSGFALLFARGCRRLPVLSTPAMATALALCVSCGGGSSHHTTQGTPPGTYTATVTASSGSLTHSMSLEVIVQ